MTFTALAPQYTVLSLGKTGKTRCSRAAKESVLQSNEAAKGFAKGFDSN